MDTQVKRILLLFVLSYAGALISLFLYLAVLGRGSFSGIDYFYGLAVYAVFNIIPILVCVLSAIFAFGLSLFCLQDRNLFIAVPIVYGSVFAEIIIVTWFWNDLGWYFSYVPLIGAMLFCRFSWWGKLRLSDSS